MEIQLDLDSVLKGEKSPPATKEEFDIALKRIAEKLTSSIISEGNGIWQKIERERQAKKDLDKLAVLQKYRERPGRVQDSAFMDDTLLLPIWNKTVISYFLGRKEFEMDHDGILEFFPDPQPLPACNRQYLVQRFKVWTRSAITTKAHELGLWHRRIG